MAGELAGRGLAVPPGTFPNVGLESSGTFGVNPVPIPPGYMLVVRFNAGFSATLTGLYVDGKTSDNAFTGVLYATKRYRRPITGGGYLSVLASAADANIAWDIVPDASVPPFDGVLASGQPSQMYTQANVAGTVSTTPVNAGIGSTSSIAFTPLSTGKVKVTFTYNAATATGTTQANAQACFGTGTAPANGAGPTGTLAGSVRTTGTSAAARNNAMMNCVIVTGLTIGTVYWFDLQYYTGAGADAMSMSGVDVVIEEMA